jgi:hypothetical protein
VCASGTPYRRRPDAVDSAQALRTLRPLRRRAAMTARPPGVAMRARNPCVFARLRLFGWNVRLLMWLTPSLAGRSGVISCIRGRGMCLHEIAPPGRKAARLYRRAQAVSTNMAMVRRRPCAFRKADPWRTDSPQPWRVSLEGRRYQIRPTEGGRNRFPKAPAELDANLLIMWKTQDSCGFSLWTTPWGRLLAHPPSGRIGGVVRGVQKAAVTLKTPAQRVYGQSDSSSAPGAIRESSTGFRTWRGHRRPLSTTGPLGTDSESGSVVRYTVHLVFRLRW